MHYAQGFEVFQPLKDISNEGSVFLLTEHSLFLEFLLEGALLAEFSGQIAVVAAFEDLVAADNVGVAERAEDLNLLLEELLHFGGVEGGESDDFEGEGLVWVGEGVLERRWVAGCTLEKLPLPSRV
jgi:hypothetical protein